MTSDSLDLLDEVERTLRETLAPQLAGEQRYLTLLTANAVATVRREAAVGDRPQLARATQRDLAGAIRSGLHDDDEALYERLLSPMALNAWIADPDALTEAERETFIGVP